MQRLTRGSLSRTGVLGKAVGMDITNMGIISSRKGNPSAIEFWEFDDGRVFDSPFLLVIHGFSLPMDHNGEKPIVIRQLDYAENRAFPNELHEFVRTRFGPFAKGVRYRLMFIPEIPESEASPQVKGSDEQEEKAENLSCAIRIFDSKTDEFLPFNIDARFIRRQRRKAEWQ